MKATEIRLKTDNSGHLKIDYPLDKKNRDIRVIILWEEDAGEPESEKLWLQSISDNPVFDFLNEPEENIYSLKDGDPLND